jgi:hypothetical protein
MLGIFKVWENQKIGDRIGKVIMKMEFKVKNKDDNNSMQYVSFIRNRVFEFINNFEKMGPQTRDIFVDNLSEALTNLPNYLQDDYAEIVTQINCLEFFTKQIRYEKNNPEIIEAIRKRGLF